MEGLVYNNSPWGKRSLKLIYFIWIARRLNIPKDMFLIVARILHHEWKPTLANVKDAYEVVPFPDQKRVFELYNNKHWKELVSKGNGHWTRAGSDLYPCTECYRPVYGRGTCRLCAKRLIDKIGEIDFS